MTSMRDELLGIRKSSPDMPRLKGMAIHPARSAYRDIPTSFNQIRVTQYRVILDVA
jgi:hypothetical protein